MNNPSWCCEQYATYIALGRIIKDLERILYE